jgi:hypothetical protein
VVKTAAHEKINLIGAAMAALALITINNLTAAEQKTIVGVAAGQWLRM